MSRVVVVEAAPDAVSSLCETLGIAISVIEPLPSGGTRLILNNSADAEKIRQDKRTKLVVGSSVRPPLYVSRTRVPP